MQVTSEGFSLTLNRGNARKKESLAICGEYPNTALAQFIFSQLGFMHLIAPYEAKLIRTNFGVASETRQLISEMYGWEKRLRPKINAPKFLSKFNCSLTDPKKVAIAYSAGKDSMWNLWRASERYGMENVLPVHIKGLNQGQASEESEYALRQFKAFGVKNYAIIELRNGSQNRGFAVMRSRDMFLASLLVPYALSFDASQILIEGFAETAKVEQFTDNAENMELFNSVLKKWELPVRVSWKNRQEMDCVKDLYLHRQKWMPHVCNCFTVKVFKQEHKRTCARLFPSLKLYDSQCGLCVKCRIVTLGRILYSPEKIDASSVKAFLENTAKWIPTKIGTHADMIEGSFMRDFNRARRKYSLNSLVA